MIERTSSFNGPHRNATVTGAAMADKNGYIRWNHRKETAHTSSKEMELGVKPHGLLARTIRFFGGPTKEDMKDNKQIREMFVAELKRDYPQVAEQVLWQTKFIKEGPAPEGYVLRHEGEPLTVGQVNRLRDLAFKLKHSD